MKSAEEVLTEKAAEELAEQRKPPTFASSLYFASVFSFTVAGAIIVYLIVVIFLVPSEWLEGANWDVFRGLINIKTMIFFSFVLLPFLLIMQIITGINFARRKLLLEFIALLLGGLICALFFWPGWLT